MKERDKTISKLKLEIDELNVYKNGYEKGVKEIKKDLLVLKFVNKTKTSLLRKYAERLEGANKYIDAADLRPQLKLYIQNSYSRTSESPSDAIYLRNQLKMICEQESLVNTADLCDFFVQVLVQRDREKANEIKRRDELIKKLHSKQTDLTNNLEKHRTNVSNLPALINSIMEDYLIQLDRDKSQEQSINRTNGGTSRGESSTNKGRKKRGTEEQTLITAHMQEDVDEMKWFVNDFTTELYGQLDDDQRKEMIQKLISNKLLIFSFREFLVSRLEGRDLEEVLGVGGGKRKRLLAESRSERSNTLQEERSRREIRARSEKNENSMNRSANISFNTTGKPLLPITTLPKAYPPLPSGGGATGSSKRSREENMKRLNISASSREDERKVRAGDEKSSNDDGITLNVLGKRKILRYLLRKTGGNG